MARINFILAACLLPLAACNSPKPKPVSNDISKTVVLVNGKKDSVLNNQEKNYGNATVADPCVKCLLQVIQGSDSYKNATRSVQPKDVIYKFDWITSKTPRQINGNPVNSGMQIAVIQKTAARRIKLATYLYNNANEKLYLFSKDRKLADNALPIDSSSLKKIRNSCFWGVASAK